MSLPRCPLPPDPGYEKSSNFYCSPTYEGQVSCRVRPEAVEIARMHTAGTVATLLTTQPHTPHRPRTCPLKKNHTAANRHRIRQIQAKYKMKEQEKCSRPSTSLPPRANAYSHIPAKITPYTTHKCPSTTPKQQSSSPPELQIPLIDVQSPTHDATVPNHLSPIKQSQQEQPKKPLRRNFMAENITNVSKVAVKKPPKTAKLEQYKENKEQQMSAYQRGAIPKYLVSRQQRWRKEEKERLLKVPDPSVPPGHVVMPNHEKRKTLDILVKHHSELMDEYKLLSLTADTLRIKARKTALENKLTEVDDAIKIFSRPRVFVKINED